MPIAGGRGSGFRSGSRIESAVAVEGLAGLQRALRRVEGSARRDLLRELRAIAKTVRDAAKANVSHRSGRHGQGPTIEDSLRISVRQAGVSVYTDAPHARVQDQGGQVGRDHATLLKRAEVSQYMTRAVRDEQPRMSQRLQGLLATFGAEFEA